MPDERPGKASDALLMASVPRPCGARRRVSRSFLDGRLAGLVAAEARAPPPPRAVSIRSTPAPDARPHQASRSFLNGRLAGPVARAPAALGWPRRGRGLRAPAVQGRSSTGGEGPRAPAAPGRPSVPRPPLCRSSLDGRSRPLRKSFPQVLRRVVDDSTSLSSCLGRAGTSVK